MPQRPQRCPDCPGHRSASATRCARCANTRRRGQPRKTRGAEERFWTFVAKTPTCWLWTGATNGFGYARFTLVGGHGTTKQVKVAGHRYAYELVVGSIPRGLVLDHLCGVRHCVNPAHLEAVTQAENLRRARVTA